jgi:hypothetical protein
MSGNWIAISPAEKKSALHLTVLIVKEAKYFHGL